MHSHRSAQSVPVFVSEVERFCRLNLARLIGVEDMARVAKMNRFHFSRQFEKARGVTPGRYLAKLRIDKASRLAASGELSVKEIAAQCGFGNGNYLCKVFRKNYGVSPGTFKVLHGARQAT
jgi:AraC-like DNA-binding protein